MWEMFIILGASICAAIRSVFFALDIQNSKWELIAEEKSVNHRVLGKLESIYFIQLGLWTIFECTFLLVCVKNSLPIWAAVAVAMICLIFSDLRLYFGFKRAKVRARLEDILKL
ncbi:MAG: hypothetical protein LBR74_00605 [Eubacterium sp.]|jgi:uncharacterized membrane protein|nr:hypothetical protein [Eubacterium sp.]